MSETVAVLGASGLIGSAFVESLLRDQEYNVRPVIHSAGHAWRLSPQGIELHQANVLNREQLESAISGCRFIVDCVSGPNRTLINGMRNIIAAARRQGIKRIVHLSSVLVYGESPASESAWEDADPRCSRGTYGHAKLRQDAMLRKEAEAERLEAVVLCIPNVSGIYSRYLLEILDALRKETFVFVENGRMPVVLADVMNVCHALKQGLKCPSGDGRRIFVNDGGGTTWADLIRRLEPISGRNGPIPSISSEEANQLAGLDEGPLKSAISAAKQIARLPEVQSIVKQRPGLAERYKRMRAKYERLPTWLSRRLSEDALREGAEARCTNAKHWSRRLIEHQLRNVEHSIIRAHRKLKYDPIYSFEESMDAFENWYGTMYGYGTEDWRLLSVLYR